MIKRDQNPVIREYWLEIRLQSQNISKLGPKIHQKTYKFCLQKEVGVKKSCLKMGNYAQ